jgi:hypothetical protein
MRRLPSPWRRELDRGASAPLYWRSEYASSRQETIEARYRHYRDAMAALDLPILDLDSWLNT